jgi:MtaA/CmuA family methyltransferase
MNALERYTACLRGRPVDCLARTPILMQYAAEYIGSDYGAFASDYRVLVEANLRCAADFDFDQVSCISDPYRETEGFGGAITYVTDGPPRCTHPLENTKDLAVLRDADPLTGTRMADRVRAVDAFRARCAGRYSILGWIEGPAAEAADLRGVMPFLMDLMDDPAFSEALMDRCVAVGIAFARAQIEAGADTIGIGDAIASQVDPNSYARLILPREKRLVDAVRAAGAKVKLHICGNITHLLGGIAELGVDILDVDHMVDLAVARRAVGPKVVLTGNMDPVAVIRNGTPQSIRAAVRAAYTAAGNPYMVNAGCEIPPGTPPENLHALCEAVPYAL